MGQLGQTYDAMTLLHCNINGLYTSSLELQLTNEEDIDIITLNETRLHPTDSFSLPNYKIIRKDRDRQGGGVAILHKTTIPLIQVDKTEIILTKLTIQQTTTYIATIYNPPQKPLPIEAITKMSKLNKIIILGDFNAHHHNFEDLTSNTRGRKLLNILQHTRLRQLQLPGSTRVPQYRRQTFTSPDKIICTQNVHNKIIRIDMLSPPNTDHVPIKITLQAHGLPKTPYYQHVTRYHYNETDWNEFRHEMTNHLKDLTLTIQTTEDLDKADERFLQTIHETREKTIPKTQQRHPTDKRRRLPQYIIDIIKLKRRAHRLYTKTRTESNRKLLRGLQTDVRNAITHFENSKRLKLLEQIEQDNRNDPANFWKSIKRLQGRSTNNDHPLRVADRIILSDKDKANVFKDTLYETFQTRNDDRTTKNNKQITNAMEKYKDYLNPRNDLTAVINAPPPITMDELNETLSRTNNRAPGPDNIPYVIYRQLPMTAKLILLRIYNTSIALGHLPKRWKKATILMFPKPGKNNTNPDNYRPISLTPTIVKILEKIIVKRLHPLLQDKIPTTQAGFRPNYNITDQLLRLITHLQNATRNKGHTATTLALDLSKAFDTVWLDGLRYKLLNMQLPTYITRWASDYLRDRTANIRIKNTHSDDFILRAGTPQGGVLSPVLFIIYMADIPQPITPKIGLSQFADDTLYWATGRNIQEANARINLQCTKFIKWAKIWKLTVNPKKTQTMAIRRKTTRRKILDKYRLKIGTESLQYTRKLKYLGYTINTKLTPQTHVQNILNNLKLKTKIITILTNPRFKTAPPNITLLLYKTLIRPYIMYAAPLLINTPLKQLDQLEYLERKIIRKSLQLPKWTPNKLTYQIAKITRLRDYMTETTKRYWTKAADRPIMRQLNRAIPDRTTLHDINAL